MERLESQILDPSVAEEDAAEGVQRRQHRAAYRVHDRLQHQLTQRERRRVQVSAEGQRELDVAAIVLHQRDRERERDAELALEKILLGAAAEAEAGEHDTVVDVQLSAVERDLGVHRESPGRHGVLRGRLEIGVEGLERDLLDVGSEAGRGADGALDVHW